MKNNHKILINAAGNILVSVELDGDAVTATVIDEYADPLSGKFVRKFVRNSKQLVCDFLRANDFDMSKVPSWLKA